MSQREIQVIPPKGDILIFRDAKLAKNLKWIRDQIGGGYVEHVSVLYNGKPASMYVDEEGATSYKNLPVNPRASEIYHAFSLSKGWSRPEAMIHGTAVLCNWSERD